MRRMVEVNVFRTQLQAFASLTKMVEWPNMQEGNLNLRLAPARLNGC